MILIFFWLASCTGSESSLVQNQFPYNTADQYFTATQSLVLEVYYDIGAEPFVGSANVNRNNIWGILEDNLNAIFQYRTSPPALTIPSQLNQMVALPTQNKTSWTSNDILNLSANYRSQESTKTESRFYIYFLNGYFNDGTTDKTNVLGISLGGTPIIAMFKDVIQASGGTLVQRFVEQSTLVHEMGHALGFVNNGVPMATNHQDTAHGKHTTNSNCVMYYLNEGASDLANFILTYQTSNSFVMWGSQTLADAQAFSR